MNVITFLKDALSLVFPSRDDERIVDALNVSTFRALLYPETKNEVTTLLPYSHNDVRSVLWEAKFHHNDTAIVLLARVLADYLSNETEELVLVPIPLAPRRFRERGFNQCELIAKSAIRLLEKGSISITLQKTRDTPPQTSLTRNMRLKNIRGSYVIKEQEKPSGKKIIVLDDVTTTGATLAEARRAFAEHNISITCIALTRAG